ncbi:MAG: PAS domain-containing protein [Gammaproteobacteria bacterium]
MSHSGLSMYAHASEPIVIVGRDGEIVFANQHAEELLDYPHGTLAGLSVEALVPESDRERHAGLREQFHKGPLIRPGREIFALSRGGARYRSKLV